MSAHEGVKPLATGPEKVPNVSAKLIVILSAELTKRGRQNTPYRQRMRIIVRLRSVLFIFTPLDTPLLFKLLCQAEFCQCRPLLLVVPRDRNGLLSKRRTRQNEPKDQFQHCWMAGRILQRGSRNCLISIRGSIFSRRSHSVASFFVSL